MAGRCPRKEARDGTARDLWDEWAGGLDVREDERELVVTVEAAGIDPKDIQLEVRDGLLTVKAEKREEQEDEGGSFRRSGRFFRQVGLPEGVDIDQARASCRNGLVVIRFPRMENAPGVRRIPIGDGEGGAARAA